MRHVVLVRPLASHQGEPGSFPGGVAPGFSHVGIMPDAAPDRWVFLGISRFPLPYIPTMLHAHLALPSSAFKTSILRAAQISSLTHSFITLATNTMPRLCEIILKRFYRPTCTFDMPHLSEKLMIPDAILEDVFEKRFWFERVELLFRAAPTRGEDDSDLGSTTSIGWRADEATQVDLTIRRVNNRERYTDVIVKSWTPVPPPKPCKVEKKKLIFEREKEYHEPYMERVFEAEERPKRAIRKDFKFLFEKPTYYDEPYVEELWDIIPTSTGEATELADKTVDTKTEAPETEPSVGVPDENNIGIQTDIALGVKLTAESITSVDETSATVNEHGNEEIITTIPQEEEEQKEDEQEEKEDVREETENEKVVNEMIKETFVDPIIETVGVKSEETEEQDQSVKMAAPVGHTILLFTEPRIYYEPYMRRLVAEDVRLQMFTWDNNTMPDVPEELSLPMWDHYLMIKQDAIPQQFDENWEWLVKNNESLFLGKDYEIALSQYFMDPSGDFGFLSGPVPEIRSLSSAIAQRCPEIVDLLHKLGPEKSRQWLSFLEKELSSDDVSDVDVEGLLTEVFPDVKERTVAMHLPEQSANGKTLILQFGDMKVVMTCKENASSNSFPVTTNLTFHFSNFTQNSSIRHKIITDIQKAGLCTVTVLRCKEMFILSVGTDCIVNKGLYLDPREIPRKIVSYQLKKNEEVHEESEKLLRQGDTPLIITVPDASEDGLKQSLGEESVQMTSDDGTSVDAGLCGGQAETAPMNGVGQPDGRRSAGLPNETVQESKTGESRTKGANIQTQTMTVLSENEMEVIYCGAGQLDPRFPPRASGAGSRAPERVLCSSDVKETSERHSQDSRPRQDCENVCSRELQQVLSLLKRMQRETRSSESRSNSSRQSGRGKTASRRDDSCVRVEVLSRSPSNKKISPDDASVTPADQCSSQSADDSTSSQTSEHNTPTSNK
ncbi:hypothetical protein PR048_030471 [Dryococelus australis]|uniref:Uncharacterized protein n=1 Tax=Dryococelus australis TaxID=614101 RepID=A0ABQ9G936_9NEOP|nr:hypothetical protein PR048_030471 [Dryococelus australis]